MFELKSTFQKKIFEKLVSNFGNSKNVESALKIPASSIRGYKNLYFKNVPEAIIKKIIQLKIVDEKEVEENTLGKKEKSEIIRSSLDKGIEATRKKFKEKKEKIPKIEEIVNKKKIDFMKWFLEYKDLLNFGLRELNIKENKNYLEVRYINFNGKEVKKFKKIFPKKYLWDKDFSYFFGLWCGDKSGGKRFGVINQNKDILNFTEKFLNRNFQEVERVLYIGEKVKEPPIKFDKKVLIKGKEKGWAISVHTINGILSSFFHYLLKNIDYLLENNLNKNAFFAGLFDAEGNVSLYNKSFRWACKNESLIPIYSKFLKKINLYDRYDGSCLISYNKKGFFEKIVPLLKNKEKVNSSYFLCNGDKEKIPKEFKRVLNYLRKNPLSTQKEIAKALKKTKVYSELGLLKEFNFIISESYPLRFKLNKEIKNISGE